MADELPLRKKTATVEKIFVRKNNRGLKCEGGDRGWKNYVAEHTRITEPKIVRPGPKARLITGRPAGSPSVASKSRQTCGNVADDILPRSRNTRRLAAIWGS